MLKKLQALDTTELLILVGVLGVLIFGGFHLYLRGQVAESEKALREARRNVPKIFALLEQIPELYTASRAMTAGGEDINPASYFTRQFTNYAKLPYDSYTIDAPRTKTTTVAVKGKRGRRATETTVSIRFPSSRNEPNYVPRSNLVRAIYNAEARSKRWKLLSLQIEAKEMDGRGRRKTAPPEELSDEWVVKQLEFVARKPAAEGSSRR
jgi:hypothetical protein